MARSTPNTDAVQMTFGEHLEELRRRLIYSLAGFALAFCVTLYFGRDLTAWLCQPLLAVQRQAGLPESLYNFSVVSSFMAYVKVSTVAALIVSGPWIVYQFWKFVEAGLYTHERRLFVLTAPTCALLTALSVWFTYYILIPGTVAFLIQFSVTYPSPSRTDHPFLDRMVRTFMRFNEAASVVSYQVKRPNVATHPSTIPRLDPGATFIQPLAADPPEPAEGQTWLNSADGRLKVFLAGQVRTLSVTADSLMTPLIGINEYLNLVLTLALVMAIAFQIPVVMTLASGLGLLTAAQLGGYRRYVFFALFVVGVFITPSQDVFSNVVIPLVMYALFELGLIMMRMVASPADRAEPDSSEPRPPAGR